MTRMTVIQLEGGIYSITNDLQTIIFFTNCLISAYFHFNHKLFVSKNKRDEVFKFKR